MKKHRKSSSGKNSTFSVQRLFSKAFTAALNPELLGLQGLTLLLSLLAFVVFTFGMGLVVFLTTIFSLSTGIFPIAVFTILLGIAIWVLGIMSINAFLNGVQFHLGMQAVSRKPLDLHLAWKLSSARWHDALLVQGSIAAIVVGLIVLSLIPSFFFPSAPSIIDAIRNPSGLGQRIPITLLVLGIFLFLLEPFLIMAPPIAYFENAKPTSVFDRVRKYVNLHYQQVLLSVILLVLITTFVNILADLVTGIPFSQVPVKEAAFSFVLVSGFSFIVQIIAILFSFTLAICTQTLMYLHVGKPQANNVFVTKGLVSRTLSSLARSHPRHSPYLPAKWKKPGKK